MSLRITTHVEPIPRSRSLHVHQPPEPAWRLLHRIADAAFPELQTLWATVFADVQVAIPDVALRTALASGNALLVEEVLAPLWQRLGVAQAHRILPTLIQETMAHAAEAMIPATQTMLGVAVDIAFNVLVPETIAAIDAYIGAQIMGISDLTLQNVRQVIRQGFTEGRSLTQMMRDLEGFVGLTPRQTQAVEALRDRLTAQGLSRAATQVQVDAAADKALRLRVESIARTESLAASNMGNHALLTQTVTQGLVDAQRIRRHWLVAADRRLCPRCAPVPGMNPEGVGVTEPFQTPGGGVLYPPLHPMCVTGDTLITSSSRILAASKRWYEGEMLIILTATGQQLTCTPNHPILTPHGWARAGHLNKGSNIICCTSEQRESYADDDIDGMPSCIEEITQTLRLSSCMCAREVPLASPAFHGDGGGSKVAIIWADSLLGTGRDTARCQQVLEQGFCGIHAPTRLQRFRYPVPSHWRDRMPQRCGMRCGNLSLSFLGRHLLPLDNFRFRLPSSRDILCNQSVSDSGTRDSIMVSESFFGHPITIQMDQLIQIKRYSFCGHVYNLQTVNGWYSANAIITHNCRCTVSTSIT